METMHRVETPPKHGPGTNRRIRPLLGRDDTNDRWLTGSQSPVSRPFVSYNFDLGTPLVLCSIQSTLTDFTRVLLIIIAIVQVDFFHVCECTVGVDVRDGTTSVLISIVAHVVMGCIVLGRQMNVDFSISGCINTDCFVGMDVVRFCTMKIHDSMILRHRGASWCIVESLIKSYFCIGTSTNNPILTILHKITSWCCNSGACALVIPSLSLLLEEVVKNHGKIKMVLQTKPPPRPPSPERDLPYPRPK